MTIPGSANGTVAAQATWTPRQRPQVKSEASSPGHKPDTRKLTNRPGSQPGIQ